MTRSTFALLMALQLTLPPFFGADKVKHFLLSFLVQSTGYSAARAAGLNRGASQSVGAAGVATVGLLKEIQDKRNGKPFSVGDLAVDAAGGVAAAALLNGAR
jgi:uncharacterized protein YfiM (DUF2279 family)